MKVLFLNPQQYVPFDLEPSNYELRLPIMQCGEDLVGVDFCYQQIARERGQSEMVAELLAIIEAEKPDIIFNSTTWPHENVPRDVLDRIRKSGVLIATVMWDTHIRSRPHELDLFGVSDFFIIADSVANYVKYRLAAELIGNTQTVLFLGGNQVLRSLFRPRDVSIRHDVLIPGSQEGHRIELVDFLKSKFVLSPYQISTAGGLVNARRGKRPDQGLSADWLDWDAYVNEMNAARIIVICQTVRTRNQIKGKLFEALACRKLCLVEEVSDLKLLVPDECVVFYSDLDDLYQKVHRYLNNPALIEEVAAKGFDWYLKTFDPALYWRTFFAYLRQRGPDLQKTRASFPSMYAPIEDAYKRVCVEKTGRIRSAVGYAETMYRASSSVAEGTEMRRIEAKLLLVRDDVLLFDAEPCGFFATRTPYFDIYASENGEFSITSQASNGMPLEYLHEHRLASLMERLGFAEPQKP